MKWFLQLGNNYANQSDWKDFALVKFCLFAMGILVGVQINPEKKKAVSIAAGLVFLATYLPLMGKVFKIAKEQANRS